MKMTSSTSYYDRGPNFARARAPCSCHSCFVTHISSLSAIYKRKENKSDQTTLLKRLGSRLWSYQIGEDGTAQKDHVSSSRWVFDADFEFLE
jgi:hypothetical protein